MRVVRAIGWMALVIVGSLAAAGLVLALDHRPTPEARPELTAADAAVLAPRLAALEPALESLAAAAQAVADAGRETLVRLRALDLPGTTDALTAGDVAMGDLALALAQVRAQAAVLRDGLGDGRHLPPADRARLAAIDAALVAADGLPRAWADIGAATAAPARVLIARRDHEAAVRRAMDLLEASRIPEALAHLDAADAALADVAQVRTAAADAGRDVSALDAWIDPVAAHTTALRRLALALEAANGIATPEVEAARRAVDETKGPRPATDDALVAAVTDLGAGDLTAHLLAIEEARGAIEAALAAEPDGDVPR
jgi:hypothetical protein